MNEQRDKKFVQRSIDNGLASIQGDPWLAQRIIASVKGEVKMKKKFTLIPVLAAFIIIAIAAVAIAETAGINVFELFGKTDKRYAELNSSETLEAEAEATVKADGLGSTSVAVSSAYYDGQSLIIGYSIQNGSRMEAFTPGEELLGKMTPMDAGLIWMASCESEAELIEEYEQAKNNGTPAGLAKYSVYAGDHTTTDDGTDIGPHSEKNTIDENGIAYTILEYDSPLNAAVRNLDRLTINVKLYQSANYLYFDGEKQYAFHEMQELSTVKSTILNSHAPAGTYSGSGEYDGLQLTARASVSAVSATLKLSFDEPLPSPPEGEGWYVFRLSDENGTILHKTEAPVVDGGNIEITYEGTGTLPQQLQLIICVKGEDTFEPDAAMSEAAPIILNLQQPQQ